MFGHQDDVIKQDQKSNADVPLPDSALSALTSAPVTTPPTDSPAPAASTPAFSSPSEESERPEPVDEADAITLDSSAPPEDFITKAEPPTPAPVTVHTDDLLDIKHEALNALSPLVDKLDLSPEEKFKTIMMLIQASDDQTLIASAYELAKQIPEEKAKAQALLDVVNEINYFTQKDSSKE